MNVWIARAAFLLVLCGILTLEAHPGVLFEHKIQHKNFTLYSQAPLGPDAVAALRRAAELVGFSPIYNPGQKYEIYVANSGWMYLLLGPDFGVKSFARTNPFDKIIIRRCDFGASKCYSGSTSNNERELPGLIAHEVTHVNIRKRFGYFAEIALPAWKKEGVADYIAQSGSFQGTGNGLVLSPGVAVSKSFEYYQYRKVAAYALEDKGLSVEEYFGGNYDYAELLAQAIRAQGRPGAEL